MWYTLTMLKRSNSRTDNNLGAGNALGVRVA